MLNKHHIVISERAEQTEEDVLDIHQIQIIRMYDEALNMPNIRSLIFHLRRSRALLTYIERNGQNFYFSMRGIKNFQSHYNWCLVFIVKKILQAYHKKEVIKISWIYGKNNPGFDTKKLTKKERGILTMILKEENRRLKRMGIVGRRKRQAYYKRN